MSGPAERGTEPDLTAKIESLDGWSVPNLALHDLVRRADVLGAIRSNDAQIVESWQFWQRVRAELDRGRVVVVAPDGIDVGRLRSATAMRLLGLAETDDLDVVVVIPVARE